MAPNKTPILIVLLFVVLLGGGGAAWFILRKKEDDEVLPITPEPETPISVVGGRTSLTNAEIQKSTVIANLLANGGGSSGNGTTNTPAVPTPPPVPVVSNTPEGEQLIIERARQLQQSDVGSTSIRANHKVGRTLTDPQTFPSDTVDAIKEMMGGIQNVDPEDYSTYPIYGKWETNGPSLRKELQDYLDEGEKSYSLSKWSDRDHYWIKSLSLNLYYGTREPYVDAPAKFTWGGLNQKGVDFYKKMNGNNVANVHLLEFKNGEPTYRAGYMYKFVQKWVAEIDYFNLVTIDEAKAQLLAAGIIVNPSKADKMNGK